MRNSTITNSIQIRQAKFPTTKITIAAINPLAASEASAESVINAAPMIQTTVTTVGVISCRKARKSLTENGAESPWRAGTGGVGSAWRAGTGGVGSAWRAGTGGGGSFITRD